MHYKHVSAGDGRMFLVYVSGSQRVVVDGRMLFPSGRPIKTDRDIPTDARNATLVVNPSRELAKAIFGHVQARRVGVLEIISQRPIKLPIKLATTPHRKLTSDQFEAIYDLRGRQASAPVVEETPPVEPAPVEEVVAEVVENTDVTPLTVVENEPVLTWDESQEVRVTLPTEEEEPTVLEEPPAEEEEGPAVEQVPPLEEEPEEAPSSEPPADPEATFTFLGDGALDIPWTDLEENPQSFKIRELREMGKHFDPAPNGVSKEEIAHEILRAGRVTGLI